MRVQNTTLAALALVAGLTLSACQGKDDSAAGANDSGSSSASSSSSSSSSEKSGGNGGSDENGTKSGGNEGSDEKGAQSGGGDMAEDGSMGGGVTTGTCKTKNLDMSAAHGMGEGTLVVTLKNTGEACSLKGFPGVDLKADDGPGGISANRSDAATPGVALQNGKKTRFTLHYPRNDSGGSGVDITRLVVTPPNETHSKTVPISTINLPVSDHSTSDVTVEPVGAGKQ